MKHLYLAALLLASPSLLPGAEIKSVITFARENAGRPLPRFSNGYAIFYENDPAQITTFRMDGTPGFAARLDLPGVTRLRLIDAAAQPDGTVAVLATLQDPQQSRVTSAVAWFSPSGQVAKVHRLTHLAPLRLAVAPNGHLWVWGRLPQPANSPGPAADALWEFDPEGRFLQDRWPHQTQPGAPEGVLSPLPFHTLIATNATGVVFYALDSHELIHCSWSTGVTRRAIVPPAWSAHTNLTGASLDSSGVFRLAGTDPTGPTPRHVVYSIDEASQRFTPLDLTSTLAATRVGALLGGEGPQLLVYGHPASVIRVQLD